MLKLVVFACAVALSLGGVVPQGNYGIAEHIVGGRNTDISEVPYQVAMLKSGRFMCGGSIVAPKYIVTAAHCVEGQSASTISFRAGSSSANSGGVLVKAKALIPHSYYSSRTMDYDVAVVELAEPLTYSNTIKPISLATSEPSSGSSVKVSGWGLLRENGALASTLQSVNVPVVARNTCSNFLSKYVAITSRMFCAGVEGKDACQGDSGGPLNSNGKLAGVVSFGIGCARRDLPGVYTNVANPDITAFIRKYAKI